MIVDDDGTLVEGVVDRAFLEGGHDETPATWAVVDFKTDKELDLALDIYRRQVGPLRRDDRSGDRPSDRAGSDPGVRSRSLDES